MGIISYLLVGTANPHCVQEPFQFYSQLVCCSTMLFMSVSTQSHAHCFGNALNDLKILVICSCSFQDDQEFSPTATQLCKFISGTAHQNFILQNSWHTVARSGQKWLGISRWPQPLFMISSTADLWFFSPCRVLKEVENASICYTLTRYCFLPIQAVLLYMTLLKFWTLPTIKILPPLAPLLPIWLILSFPTHKFDRLDRVDQSLSDPFFLLWICPCKILLFYYFAQIFKLTC